MSFCSLASSGFYFTIFSFFFLGFSFPYEDNFLWSREGRFSRIFMKLSCLILKVFSRKSLFTLVNPFVLSDFDLMQMNPYFKKTLEIVSTIFSVMYRFCQICEFENEYLEYFTSYEFLSLWYLNSTFLYYSNTSGV